MIIYFTFWNQPLVLMFGVAIEQHEIILERSTYEVLQIPSTSLTDKNPLKGLSEMSNINDVKVLFAPNSGAILLTFNSSLF